MKPFDLLIFTQYPKAYGPQRLMEEARKLGMRSEELGYEEITEIKNLPSAKYVILREPNVKDNLYRLRDQILKYYLSTHSFVLNSHSYRQWSVLDKFTQHQEFKKAGISHIKLLKWQEARYPFVVKAKLGSHGDHVFKIENDGDMKKVLAKYKKEDLLVQEFQKAGFDLRVIVLGGRVLGVMKRTPKAGEFLSNFSQGGSVERFETEIEIEIEKLAIKTARHFKLDFAGVDIMRGNNGEWKALEVNRACQFKGFEKATGVNVACETISLLTL